MATLERCLYCGMDNPDNYRFCKGCRNQIKCADCNSILEADADMCFVCGSKIVLTSSDTNANKYRLRNDETIGADGSQRRTLEMDLSVSTEGLSHLGNLLSILPNGIASNQPTPIARQMRNMNSQFNNPTIDVARPRALLELSEPTVFADSNNVTTADEIDIDKFIDESFSFTTDNVTYNLSKYTHRTAKEKQIGFTVLYFAAYNRYFGCAPDREKVIEFLNINSLKDKNWASYFSSDVNNKLIIVKDGQVTITAKGIDKLRLFISYILEIKQEDGKAKPRVRKSNGTRSSYDDEQKAILLKAIESSKDLPAISVRESKNPREVAAISLYILTQKLDLTHSATSRLVYEYAKSTFTKLPYDSQAFSEGVGRRSQGYFRKDEKNWYYLTDVGREFVNSWLDEHNLSALK